jgi:hypothetical protein
VEHRHGAGGLALGEARGVLERVDRGAPERDAPLLEPAVELLERVARLVEQAAHPAVHDARDLGPGVHATEAEHRVRAHLRRLAAFGISPSPSDTMMAWFSGSVRVRCQSPSLIT